MDSYENWSALRGRVLAMPLDRQAAFALACAQGALGPDVESLSALVELGWDALLDGGDVSQAVTELENVPYLDDDPVAATYYALSSLQGEAGAAWWAASRAMDLAFSRVEYPSGAQVFRPLEVDARTTVVQAEIARQARLLETVESAPNLALSVSRLRAR
ncbi:hypothetical protein ACIBL3_25740 [Kribbella sp. NPDC050124]|uniref:hypothetical protein n=1 Tax=Kribbella sp. NPDC050124 TaxID=3364114 RepID=UPI0037B7CE23